MNEETQVVEAAPSAVELEIPRSGSPEYAQWRVDGTLPEKKQPQHAESATADTSKETKSEAQKAETAPEAETGKSTQETRRKPGAEARIGELTSRVKQLERELQEARKPVQTKEAESSPAPQPQYTRSKPTAEDKKQDGTPKYGTYEDFVEDLADWKAEQRWVAAQREQSLQAQQRELNTKVNEARSRYANFDEVIKPFIGEFVGDHAISSTLKAMVNDSEVFADLVFTLADDPNFMAVAKNEPGKAIRYIAKVEGLIQEELSKARNDKGQFTAKQEPPAKRGPESAPEPPIEIGSRGSGPMDESERALSAIGRGDLNATRQWLRVENAKDIRRRKGI